MIKSMTGFGRAEYTNDQYHLECELRSINHRFLDLSLRIPAAINQFEGQIRNQIQSRVKRGKINLILTYESFNEQIVQLSLNEPLLNNYLQLIAQLKSNFAINDQISINSILSIPNIIEREISENNVEDMAYAVEKVINCALDDLDKMRIAEGNYLAADLEKRINFLSKQIDIIETTAKVRLDIARTNLRERIKTLVDNIEIDENRLYMEIGILADKLDLSEECMRFNSHNQQFIKYLNEDEPTGRRLNFLLQEMNRESNTISSKANNYDIVHLIVEIKEEIEKIREQVQNIE